MKEKSISKFATATTLLELVSKGDLFAVKLTQNSKAMILMCFSESEAKTLFETMKESVL